jgi:hypothetical protein
MPKEDKLGIVLRLEQRGHLPLERRGVVAKCLGRNFNFNRLQLPQGSPRASQEFLRRAAQFFSIPRGSE